MSSTMQQPIPPKIHFHFPRSIAEFMTELQIAQSTGGANKKTPHFETVHRPPQAVLTSRVECLHSILPVPNSYFLYYIA